MDRQFIKLFWGVSLLIGISLLSACQDKDYYDPENNPSDVGNNPSTLNFLTTKEVAMDFNYKVIKGFRSKYDIYAEPPLTENGTLRSGVAPVASGIAIAGEMVTRVLPAYATDLYLYSTGLFVPTLSYAKVENGRAVFSQIDAMSGQNNVSQPTRSIGEKSIDKYLKEPSDFYTETANGVYENDLINPDKVEVIPSEVLTAINATFPEGNMPDPKYYTDATIEIKNDEGAGGVRVYVSVIHAAGKLNNSLSYFTYRGEKAFKDFDEDEKNKLKVTNIFKYADVYTNSTENKNKGLTPGKYAQLLYIDENGNESDLFPVGSKIGWVLHSGAYNGISNGIHTSYAWMFSTPEWNPSIKGSESLVASRDRTIFFETKYDGVTYNCFGFEDYPQWDNDCNDVIFRVLTDPENAIAPPPSIDVEDIEYNEEKKGVLAFEDMWPTKGDYDLNDVVVKYHSTITYTQEVKTDQSNGTIVEYGDTYVSKLKDIFSLIHAGASYENSFCYKMNLDPSIIKSLKIENQSYTPIKDGDGFIIELCPLVSSSDGTGAIESYKYGTTPKKYMVEIEFEEGKLSEKDFVSAAAPYNPFIVPQVDKKLKMEIHLPNYPPTTQVDYNFFGTEDDRSSQNKGLWYVSGEKNIYPFAIHLANAYDDFIVPAEGKPITETYSEYGSWVESGMTSNLKWYLNPKGK